MKKSVRSSFVLLLVAAVLQLGLMPSCDKDEPNQPVDPDDPTTKLTKEQQAVLDVVKDGGSLPSSGFFVSTEIKHVSEKEIGYSDENGKPLETVKVITTEHVDYKENRADFSLLDPWTGVIWPGALIQGKTVRGSSIPTPINIFSKRKKHEIIFGSGMGSVVNGDPSLSVETEMKESAVIRAQNKLLSNFFKQNSETPANYVFDLKTVYCKEDLLREAKINVNAFGGTFASKFSGDWNSEKTRILVELQQVFYTMTCPGFDMGPLGCFTEDLTAAELSRYTGPGNPICYVASVSYGRVYYLLYESSVDEKSLELSLQAKYKTLSTGGEVKAKVDSEKILRESSITLLQYGGNAADGLQAALHPTQENLDKLIIEGAKFSPTNPGAPISYTIKQLGDDSQVSMNNMLSYEREKVEFRPAQLQPKTELYIDGVRIKSRAEEKYNLSASGSAVITGLTIEYDTGNRTEKRQVNFIKDHYVSLLGDVTKYSDFEWCVDSVVKTIEMKLSLKMYYGSYYKYLQRLENDEELLFTIKLLQYDSGRWCIRRGQADLINGQGFTISDDVTHTSHTIYIDFHLWSSCMKVDFNGKQLVQGSN